MMGAVWNLIMAQASVLGLVNVPLNLKKRMRQINAIFSFYLSPPPPSVGVTSLLHLGSAVALGLLVHRVSFE